MYICEFNYEESTLKESTYVKEDKSYNKIRKYQFNYFNK
jgi:hypothetical protein